MHVSICSHTRARTYNSLHCRVGRECGGNTDALIRIHSIPPQQEIDAILVSTKMVYTLSFHKIHYETEYVYMHIFRKLRH